MCKFALKSLMKKRIEALEINNIEHLDGNFILISLKSNNPLPEIIPGQFVEIEIRESRSTFLRRPYSIHDVNYSENSIILLIKIVGEGTRTISKMQEGEMLNTIFPLGNGFSFQQEKEILFIGGGYGVAPFLYFSIILRRKNIRPTILFGARSKNDLIRLDHYKKLGDLYITTEDGSLGHKGLVTEHPVLEEKKNDFKQIYTCGPEVMMMAVGRYAEANNIDCEVSLDNLMACGIGACLCCVTKTKEGNKMVCSEGPVFNLKELAW